MKLVFLDGLMRTVMSPVNLLSLLREAALSRSAITLLKVNTIYHLDTTDENT